MPASHVSAHDRVIYEGSLFVVAQIRHNGIDLIDVASETVSVWVPTSDIPLLVKVGNREEALLHRGKPADWHMVFVSRGGDKLSMGATDSYEQAIGWIKASAEREALQHGTCTLIAYDSGLHAVYSSGAHALYEIAPHYISL